MSVPCNGCGLRICPEVCPAHLRHARIGLLYGERAVRRATARSRISQRRRRYRVAVDRWLDLLGLPSCPPAPVPEPWPAHETTSCFECGRSADDADGIPVESCDCCGMPFCAACSFVVKADLWLCEHCNGPCTCTLQAVARREYEDVLASYRTTAATPDRQAFP